jgi:CubicO group peptidase (beta-lactamase class C family)
MKKFLLLLLLPLTVGAQDFATKAEQYLKDQYDQGKFTGNVLVAHKGQILLQESYGWANQAAGKPNTLQTRFRIASVSKQFAATLIMQLVEKGKLKVSDPIIKFLKDYPKGDSITVRQLLSHTSGIPEMTKLPGFVKNNIAAKNLYQKIDFFKSAPLESKPGTKFSYANSNFLLLSAIAEKLSGLSYNMLLQQEILDKVPMKNSGVNKTDVQVKDIAQGYAQLGADKWKTAAPRPLNEGYGAGGMYSTVGDLYLWDRVLYSNKILTERSKKQMYTPVRNNYGYGWSIRKSLGKTEYSHNGKTNGFLSQISRFPDDDACIIVLSNSTSTKPGEIKTELAKLLFLK